MPIKNWIKERWEIINSGFKISWVIGWSILKPIIEVFAFIKSQFFPSWVFVIHLSWGWWFAILGFILFWGAIEISLKREKEFKIIKNALNKCRLECSYYHVIQYNLEEIKKELKSSKDELGSQEYWEEIKNKLEATIKNVEDSLQDLKNDN